MNSQQEDTERRSQLSLEHRAHQLSSLEILIFCVHGGVPNGPGDMGLVFWCRASPPTMSGSRATKVVAATGISRMQRTRPYKTVQGRQLCMTQATATFFPVCGCSCAQDHPALEGSTCEPMTFKLQEYHETTCVSDQQT